MAKHSKEIGLFKKYRKGLTLSVILLFIGYYQIILALKLEDSFYLYPFYMLPILFYAAIIKVGLILLKLLMEGLVKLISLLKKEKVQNPFIIENSMEIKMFFYGLFKNILISLFLISLIVSTLKFLEIIFRANEFYKSQKLIGESDSSFVQILDVKSILLFFSFFVMGIIVTILGNLHFDDSVLKKLKYIWWSTFKLWGFLISLLATLIGLILTIQGVNA